jgi:STE24 endopeptidase
MSLVAVALAALLVGTEAFFTALAVLDLRHEAEAVEREREWVESELGVDDPGEVLDYRRARTGVSLLSSWVVLGAVLLVLFSGLFADAVAALASSGLSPVAQGVAFAAGAVLALRAVRVPFDLVETFVVEEIFGFNNQTPRLWLRDFLLSMAVTLALVAVLAAGVLWFVETVPYWPAAAWALVVAFGVAMLVVKPRVIDPLFYEFTPIDEGDLRDAVEEVFERAGFACEQIYEMDASTRSSHSNAYFVGFGRTKRVVLFDTLLEHLDEREVQGVLAHELAHWKKGHVWKFVGLFAARYAVVFVALGWLVGADWLYAFGVPETAYAGLALALLWVLPVVRLASPLDNAVSLRFEREADRFAADVAGAEPLASALADMASENLVSLFPHPLYETFHHDHPPIPERIRRLREMGDDADAAGADAEPA